MPPFLTPNSKISRFSSEFVHAIDPLSWSDRLRFRNAQLVVPSVSVVNKRVIEFIAFVGFFVFKGK